MNSCLAHRSEDGREQSIEAHLEGTATLCAAFAREFDAEEQGHFIGSLHDIGKNSDEFQKRLHGGMKVDHSTAGALECARAGVEWGAFCVAGHHSGLPDGGNLKTDLPGEATLFGRIKKGLNRGIPDYEKNWKRMPLSVQAPAAWGKDGLTDSFVIRMLYSCLVDADYLDTERFMQNGQVERGVTDSISTLLERLEAYIAPWQAPKNELNRLRCQILNNCIDGATGEKGLYSLTVPTGGGKTIASMAFALHHAKQHGMARVIYVIPYTSIIEQNAAVFRSIFGERNVLEHHSGVEFDKQEDADETDARIALATENWDAPIVVTTAVQFFESLYANRSSKCRKLHNLANSVLIFDEAQMLPTNHLRPCVAAIAKLVQHFGATAVLCTATQPVLGDLFWRYAGLTAKELCPNTVELYDGFRRVTFRNAGMLAEADLTEVLSALPQVLCIVNTRKQAQEIYHALPKEGSFHLSTLMYPAHRRAVLAEIRKRLAGGLPCRVVSTSLIEAGVDVDFLAVYRELAGLDSILQAAGRCNREGKRPAAESIVTVFETKATPPPLLRVNIGATREALSDGSALSDPQTVTRYFSAYRSLAGKGLDKYGVVEAFETDISGCRFPFETVAKRFFLIDSATKTVYIPLGDGQALTEQMKAGLHSRELYRKAGQYAVSIYEQQFRALLASGDIEPLGEDSAVLIDLSLYDSATGLSQNADYGKNLFI